jgi:hypothetical protein
MSLEASLWTWLAKARQQLGLALDINRIENWAGPGMPDVEGHLRLPDATGQFWLELKAEPRPKRPGTTIRFKVRTKQIEWINRRWAIGGNVFWLLQVGLGSDRVLFLAPGPLGPQLQRGLHETALAVECAESGTFSKTISQQAILKKAVTCRFRIPSLSIK